MAHYLGQKYNVLGVKVDVLTRQLFVDRINEIIVNDRKATIFTPYSEFIYKAVVDPKFSEILNSADLSIADGVFVQIASLYNERINKSNVRIINLLKILKLIILMILRRIDRSIVFPELLSGSNEIKTLCKLAESKGYSIYMAGGTQNVPYIAAQNLCKEYKNLNIVGVQSGRSFTADDNKIIAEINQKDPDILLLCYGGQKQERWIAKYKDQINTSIVIGLGGTFDYVSGKLKLQSKWWSDRGLNWLHRLISEPWRWKRQTTILKLLWILADPKRN